MKAGDNTLNTLLAVEFTKVMQREDPNHDLDPEVLRGKVIEEYVRFMTTPNSHGDTYCESFHRLFFREWTRLENPPKDGPGLIEFCKQRWECTVILIFLRKYFEIYTYRCLILVCRLATIDGAINVVPYHAVKYFSYPIKCP